MMKLVLILPTILTFNWFKYRIGAGFYFVGKYDRSRSWVVVIYEKGRNKFDLYGSALHIHALSYVLVMIGRFTSSLFRSKKSRQLYYCHYYCHFQEIGHTAKH